MPTAALTNSAMAAELRISVMRLARRLRAQRSDSSLTLTQLAALSTLELHGPLTLGELAAHEKVQPPSMTRVVSRLEELSLLSRSPHPTDRRQALLTVSRAGQALLKEDRRRRDAWLSRRLRDLPADDVDTLHAAAAILARLAAS